MLVLQPLPLLWQVNKQVLKPIRDKRITPCCIDVGLGRLGLETLILYVNQNLFTYLTSRSLDALALQLSKTPV